MSESTEERLRRLERASATGDHEARRQLRRLRRSLGHLWEERIAALRQELEEGRAVADDLVLDGPEDVEWLASSLRHATEALRLAELRDLPQLECALEEALEAVAPNDGIAGGEGQHLWDGLVEELERAIDDEQRRLDPSISARETAWEETWAAQQARAEEEQQAKERDRITQEELGASLEAAETRWRVRMVLILVVFSIVAGLLATLP